MLTDIIKRDSLVEDLRLRLASCDDFTVNDLWDYFNPSRRSFLDVSDIQSGLDKWGMYKSFCDVELMVRKASRGLNTLS